ncbi:hypothetical protein [Metabacillus litoralis]|uniref:hypothetical protein n=1 Tax=Metabacillus litoralis TaxID=152268 RepID=UPI001CFCAAED|nr:hypothetical protein [Metabacillus litoralis]
MGETLIVIAVFIIFMIFITQVMVKPKGGRKRNLRNDPIPEQLGVQIDGGVPIVQDLNKALSKSYEENVKNRVLLEHSKWPEHEVDWVFFELKRYFFMNSLLKSVPMFSERVDVIWHEMLMFTREYETFSKGFYKETLHHMPNMESTPIPGERAFFDWVYLSLFELTPNSKAIWGRFLQHPIKREILDDFKRLSEDELLMRYFRKDDSWIDVKRQLIIKMKNEITQADSMKLGQDKPTISSTASDSQIFNMALGAAVFYSIYEEDHYQEHISEVLPTEYNKEHHFGGGASCSGYSCSSSSDSGGDSGGSSCSSCGGGCSS